MIDFKEAVQIYEYDRDEAGRLLDHKRYVGRITRCREVHASRHTLERNQRNQAEIERDIRVAIKVGLWQDFYGDLRLPLAKLRHWISLRCQDASFQEIDDMFKPLEDMLRRPF